MTNICKCGCLRPCEGEYSNRHDLWRTTRKSPVDYIVEERGFETPCWIWQLGISRSGYAKIKVNGKDVRAHVYYYEQYREELPPNTKTKYGREAELDHLCRIRACVNPWHLEVVTPLENKRRGLVAKLSREDVSSIRQHYLDGESQYQIAHRLGVRQTQISRILNGSRWSDVVEKTATRSPIKLTPEQVEQIRLHAYSGELQRDIAQAFGMSQSQIGRIVRGQSWSASMV
jgi:predicted DNA-binding protein (UPF0251 family)